MPDDLRLPLIAHYQQIARNYLERRWEPAELNAGKLCEVVYSIAKGALSGSYPPHGSKPANFVTACRALEQNPPNAALPGDRSLRLLIPRVLVSLYDVRNSRGVGHVSAEIDPNEADATFVFGGSNWLVCELIRIFHNLSVDEASAVVSALVKRRLPEIWEVGSTKRVLSSGLSARDQVLLHLYSEAGWVRASDLRDWIEYRNITRFKNTVLGTLHRERYIEFSNADSFAQISPKGVLEVEENILPRLKADFRGTSGT